MAAADNDLIRPEPLTQAGFAAFGFVIEPEGSASLINQGFARKWADLATLDCAREGGRPAVHLFRAKPRGFPLLIEALEHHALGSQAFMPLEKQRFLIVVATPDQPDAPRVFISNGQQGCVYAPGIWHHALIAFGQESDFLVIDRLGPAPDVVVRNLARPFTLAAPT
jgi:ureidoglycolate lyase